MFKKIFLPTILTVVAYGFWISPDFKAISAGVAIFLFGMLSLEEGFKMFSGGMLENILKKSTSNLYKSIAFGTITTTFMQSSSLVSILTISFLSAGLIGLSQGIGIIFGANIGTTTGAWLVAGFGLKVDIQVYAMPMIVFGIILIFQKTKSLKGIGYILAGLGFLFLGIHYMKEGFEAFKNNIDLANFAISGYKGLFIFTGIGIFATVVMQSSHATLVLIITALAAGQITYENALALAIGANIGTTITAIIGSIGSNIQGKRLAGAHLIFNAVTGFIAIIFIYQLVYIVDFISTLVAIEKDDYALKLAVFHTIFNLIGVIVMLPLVNKLVSFLEKILKDKDLQAEEEFVTPNFLNESVLEFPSTSISAITNETLHLYDNAFDIIANALNIKTADITSSMDLKDVTAKPYGKRPLNIDNLYNHKIKNLYGEILDFSTKAQAHMPPQYIEKLYKLKLANRNIVEAVKNMKHLQKNLLKYSNSTNIHIKNQYNSIRKDLAELLRDVNSIAKTDKEDETILLLSKAKIHAQKYDITANGILDNLIREHFITNEMATSLMNDSTYAYNIRKSLIAMSEILFIDDNNDAKEMHQDMVINEDDIQHILEKKGA
ncbi:Na/Pi symporter [bacterium]|nr:Na/Pi symporter [bacterium]MBU1993491.1 Na/Pi symporter [bacterium]